MCGCRLYDLNLYLIIGYVNLVYPYVLVENGKYFLFSYHRYYESETDSQVLPNRMICKVTQEKNRGFVDIYSKEEGNLVSIKCLRYCNNQNPSQFTDKKLMHFNRLNTRLKFIIPCQTLRESDNPYSRAVYEIKTLKKSFVVVSSEHNNNDSFSAYSLRPVFTYGKVYYIIAWTQTPFIIITTDNAVKLRISVKNNEIFSRQNRPLRIDGNRTFSFSQCYFTVVDQTPIDVPDWGSLISGNKDIHLHATHTLWIQPSNLEPGCDFTGTKINSDKPINVVAGNMYITKKLNSEGISDGKSDSLASQATPASKLGRLAVMLFNFDAYYKVLTKENNNEVSYFSFQGNGTATLETETDWLIGRPARVSYGDYTLVLDATKPFIMIVYIITKVIYDGVGEHPCATEVVTTNNWQTSYVIVPPMSNKDIDTSYHQSSFFIIAKKSHSKGIWYRYQNITVYCDILESNTIHHKNQIYLHYTQFVQYKAHELHFYSNDSSPFYIQFYGVAYPKPYSFCFNAATSVVNGEPDYLCPLMKWGERCEKDCPANCNFTCDKEIGSCFMGCKPGYCGLFCEKHCYCLPSTYDFEKGCSHCQVGWWGRICTKLCSHGCVAGCEQTTGFCDSQGCIDGYFGPLCQNRCYCRNNVSCSKSGICPSGCLDSFWGQECNKRCWNSCLKSCEKLTGNCFHCFRGFYGRTCFDRCHCNLNDTCSDRGICPNSCASGFWGRKCNIVCLGCKECDKFKGTCEVYDDESDMHYYLTGVKLFLVVFFTIAHIITIATISGMYFLFAKKFRPNTNTKTAVSSDLDESKDLTEETSSSSAEIEKDGSAKSVFEKSKLQRFSQAIFTLNRESVKQVEKKSKSFLIFANDRRSVI